MYIIYLVSALALVRGYPLLKRLNKIVKCFYGDVEALVEFTALLLTVARESERGILLLLFKNINDYIMLSADCNCRQTLLKNAKRADSISDIDSIESQKTLLPVKNIMEVHNEVDLKNGPAISAAALNNSRLYRRVTGYQARMGPIALTAAALNLLLTGSPLRSISTLLVLSPAASEVALTAGMNNYTALLAKKGIYLKNPYVIDSIVHNIDIATDKLSPINLSDIDVSFAGSSCGMAAMNSDCVIFDDEAEKLNELASLSTKAYGKIQRDITTAQAYNLFFGVLSFFININIFTAEGINTLNSLLMLILSERIRWTHPGNYLNSTLRLKISSKS